MSNVTPEEKGKDAAKFMKSFLSELLRPIFSVLLFSKGGKNKLLFFLNVLVILFVAWFTLLLLLD